MKPTPDEIKNGWTEEALAEYVRERERAAAAAIDPDSPARKVRPREQNHRYSPKRWR